MSRNSSQPDPSLLDRIMKAVEDTVDANVWHEVHKDVRKAIENELMPRTFEVRGRIVIEYAMGFSEAEAREWFPDVAWDDPERSHAGDIETDHLAHAPKDFWECVQIKREVVIPLETHLQNVFQIQDEITGVVEL